MLLHVVCSARMGILSTGFNMLYVDTWKEKYNAKAFGINCCFKETKLRTLNRTNKWNKVPRV